MHDETKAALARLREEIMDCDKDLVGVISRRRTLVQAIGTLKRQLGLPITDPPREAAVVRRAAEMARAAGVDEELVRDLIWKIIAWAREEQARPQGS